MSVGVCFESPRTEVFLLVVWCVAGALFMGYLIGSGDLL